MLQWGSYGQEVFKTAYSPSAVNDNRQWQIIKHPLINGYPGHEFQGEDQRTLKIALQLHRMFAPCQETYDRFVTMADSGQAYTLTIGNSVLGEFAIKQLGRVINSTSASGGQIEVTLSIQLVEVRNHGR